MCFLSECSKRVMPVTEGSIGAHALGSWESCRVHDCFRCEAMTMIRPLYEDTTTPSTLRAALQVNVSHSHSSLLKVAFLSCNSPLFSPPRSRPPRPLLCRIARVNPTTNRHSHSHCKQQTFSHCPTLRRLRRFLRPSHGLYCLLQRRKCIRSAGQEHKPLGLHARVSTLRRLPDTWLQPPTSLTMGICHNS